MGLIERLEARLQRTSGEPEMKSSGFDPMTFTQPEASISGTFRSLLSDGAATEAYSRIFRTQAAVYTVVEFLATQVAAIGLKTYRRVSDTDRERLTNEPLSDLIARPAPGLTYGRMMHQVVADLGVHGNAYLLKLEQGDTRALVPLPPPAITPMGGNVIAPSMYRFQLRSATWSDYTADQIVHFRRYNPDDARIGVSPLEPLRLVLRSDAAALRHWEYLWRNAARIEGWFQLPDGDLLSEEALNRLRESINQKYTGDENAGKMGILEGGAKVIPSQWSPREAEFIEGRQLTLETVARAYNIPLSVLSLTETTTFASAQSFHTQLYVDTLGPWFKTIEEQFEADIVPWMTNDPDVYVEFNVEEKLRGSFEEQQTAYRAAVGVPTMSVNEARALQGLPRLDDEAFDTPVKPANINYAGAPGQSPMPAPPQLRAASATLEDAEVLQLPAGERL